MRLQNLGIGLRILLLQVAPLCCVCLIWFIADQSLKRQSAGLQHVADVNFPKAEAANLLVTGLAETRGQLLGVAILAASGAQTSDAERLGDAKAGFYIQMLLLRNQLNEWVIDPRYDQEERRGADQIIENLESIRANADSFFQLVETDFAASTTHITAADSDFERAKAILADFAQQQNLSVKRHADEEATVAIERSQTMLSILGAALVLTLLLSFVIGRSISRPLKALTAVMRRLAEGDFDVETPPLGRNNELATMGRTISVFRENALAVEDAKRFESQRQREMDEHKRATMNALAGEIDEKVRGSVETVTIAVEDIRTAIGAVRDNVERTKVQSEAVATSSETTSNNVDTVAEASASLAATIRSVATQVHDATAVFRTAVGQAEETDRTVKNLRSASDRIGDVIGLISDIASQTNLLALNATIEAARAGEVGRGFAVVAAEVKALASQTATATEDITEEVNAIKTETLRAVEAIEEISRIITQVDTVFATISDVVSQQGDATSRISENTREAADASRSVFRDIREVQSIAVTTGTSTDVMQEKVAALDGEFQALLVRVNQLVAQLKTA